MYHPQELRRLPEELPVYLRKKITDHVEELVQSVPSSVKKLHCFDCYIKFNSIACFSNLTNLSMSFYQLKPSMLLELGNAHSLQNLNLLLAGHHTEGATLFS